MRSETAAAIARAEKAEAERDEIQAVFDRQRDAAMRGIKAWQAANPGNDNVWPDRANHMEWALGEVARLQSVIEAVDRYLCPLAVYPAVRAALDALGKLYRQENP